MPSSHTRGKLVCPSGQRPRRRALRRRQRLAGDGRSSRSRPWTSRAMEVRRQKTAAGLARIKDVLDQMIRARTPITVAAVARTADVSRMFLYEHASALFGPGRRGDEPGRRPARPGPARPHRKNSKRPGANEP